MADVKTDATTPVDVLEKAVGTVQLQRRSGSFVNKDGEVIEFQKFVLIVNGAEVSVDFDKDVKNLLSAFLKFEKI